MSIEEDGFKKNSELAQDVQKIVDISHKKITGGDFTVSELRAMLKDEEEWDRKNNAGSADLEDTEYTRELLKEALKEEDRKGKEN